MQLSEEEIRQFQKKILEWYKKNKRDLPWREIPVDTSLQEKVYRILVSEVMSQQTQIQRVVVKYQMWMKKFPTIDALAKASIADVLQYWSGLGYNRRALNLKKTAERIVKEFGGEFPSSEKMLRSLPGIGEYTARAVLCFSFGKQVAVVDTNVKKVIILEVLKETKGTEAPKAVQEIAEQLLPKGRASEWNQALMDYAAAMLKKERIPIPKQSKFIGSHRYYRGQVLKVLLTKKKVSVEELGILIKKDYTYSQRHWLQRLLNELKAEGFIVVEQEHVLLSS